MTDKDFPLTNLQFDRREPERLPAAPPRAPGDRLVKPGHVPNPKSEQKAAHDWRNGGLWESIFKSLTSNNHRFCKSLPRYFYQNDFLPPEDYPAHYAFQLSTPNFKISLPPECFFWGVFKIARPYALRYCVPKAYSALTSALVNCWSFET